MTSSLTRLNTWLDRCKLQKSDFASDVEPPWPEVGQISADESTIVGRNGWMDLYRGSNNYYDFYLTSPADAHRLASEWDSYIDYQREACKSRNISYVPLIIPNKATVLREMYPLDLPQGPTPVLELLMGMQADQDLCPIDVFSDPEARLCCFRRNDSHLTLYGSYSLLAALLDGAEVKPNCLPEPGTLIKATHAGDLGSKFAHPALEVLRQTHAFSNRLDLVYHSPPDVRNTSIRYSTYCNTAPIRKKILVFGNSYIDKVTSWGAAPLIGCTFAHMMFCWSAKFDEELLETFKPDIVVYQNCERFLARPPEAGSAVPTP